MTARADLEYRIYWDETIEREVFELVAGQKLDNEARDDKER